MYGTPAYFTATVLFDLIPMRVLPPCFFAAATYWMIGFRPGMWHLLTFLLLLVLSNMVSEGDLASCKWHTAFLFAAPALLSKRLEVVKFTAGKILLQA